jgi:hypothetical protein
MIKCDVCKGSGYVITVAPRPCPKCNGAKEVSALREMQWQLGWVLYLDASGRDASVHLMNKRCNSIIDEVAKNLGVPRPNVKDCPYENADPQSVMFYFTNQLSDFDTLQR